MTFTKGEKRAGRVPTFTSLLVKDFVDLFQSNVAKEAILKTKMQHMNEFHQFIFEDSQRCNAIITAMGDEMRDIILFEYHKKEWTSAAADDFSEHGETHRNQRQKSDLSSDNSYTSNSNNMNNNNCANNNNTTNNNYIHYNYCYQPINSHPSSAMYINHSNSREPSPLTSPECDLDFSIGNLSHFDPFSNNDIISNNITPSNPSTKAETTTTHSSSPILETNNSHSGVVTTTTQSSSPMTETNESHSTVVRKQLQPKSKTQSSTSVEIRKNTGGPLKLTKCYECSKEENDLGLEYRIFYDSKKDKPQGFETEEEAYLEMIQYLEHPDEYTHMVFNIKRDFICKVHFKCDHYAKAYYFKEMDDNNNFVIHCKLVTYGKHAVDNVFSAEVYANMRPSKDSIKRELAKAI